MSTISTHTKFVKKTADRLGFNYCGIAKAAFLEEDAYRLEKWLHNGMHGNMLYMDKNFDLRVDPRKLVPGAKSVITLLINYYPEVQQTSPLEKISKYAYGADYHEIIRGKLNHFFLELQNELGEIQGRGFVDSAPVLERSWAQKSGLGWVGKNGNLINKNKGSFFFIASLIVDIELEYDEPHFKDYCGSCTKCIDNCPTDAIQPNKVVDGSKCISYFTIELKDALIPENMQGKFDNWLFGCDTCQDVCPWNRFAEPTQEIQFKILPEILNFKSADWEELTEENFKEIFRHSPIKRTKFAGIKRNLHFLQQTTS